MFSKALFIGSLLLSEQVFKFTVKIRNLSADESCIDSTTRKQWKNSENFSRIFIDVSPGFSFSETHFIC